MAEIHHLTVVPGDNYHVEADIVLEAAKGKCGQVLVIGWQPDREIYVGSSDGVPENLLLMEVAKAMFVREYFED